VQRQREQGARHSIRKTVPVTCGERRKRLVAWGREVVCAIMPVPQEQGAGRVEWGRAQVAERCGRNADRQ
jgi:hypothetical protein